MTRGDDPNRVRIIGTPCKCPRIRQLAAKIKPAQKRKQISERHAFLAAQALGQKEFGLLVEQELRALPRAIRGRQDEVRTRRHVRSPGGEFLNAASCWPR